MAMRPEKNSERVEIRLPYSLKQRFLRACERAGETPSEALRDAMADYILRIEQAGQPTLFEEMTMKLIHNPLKAAGMTLASLAAFALVAAPSSADERLFKALDLDRDGLLTEMDPGIGEEVIYALDQDESESITFKEFAIQAVYGEIVKVDEFHGLAEPKDWESWDEEQIESYFDTLPQYDLLEGTIVWVNLSQIGRVDIARTPMRNIASSGVQKIIIKLVPPDHKKTL